MIWLRWLPIIALILALGVQTKRVEWAKAETVEIQNAWAVDRANAQSAALKATNEYRAKEAEYQSRITGAQDEYNRLQAEHAKTIVAHRAALADAGKLRNEIAEFARSGPASGDTVAAASERAATLGLLLAEALRVSAEGAIDAESNGDALRAVLDAWPR